jgi:hypothetical protein
MTFVETLRTKVFHSKFGDFDFSRINRRFKSVWRIFQRTVHLYQRNSNETVEHSRIGIDVSIFLLQCRSYFPHM